MNYHMKTDFSRKGAPDALFSLFSQKSTLKEYMDEVVRLFRSWSECECAGIRLLNDRKEIPYVSSLGFNEKFLGSESRLSIEVNQCACVRVICESPEPQDRPMMTGTGSFFCNDTLGFVSGLSESEAARFRGVCVQSGYSSVAVIPIRYRGRVVGAIHLADRQKDRVPLALVEFLENISPLLGEAVHRFHLEEELQRNHDSQKALNSILLLSFENLSVQAFLNRALELILSAPWAGFEEKGAIFLADNHANVLNLSAHKGLENEICSRCFRIAFGECLCGEAAASGMSRHSFRLGDHNRINRFSRLKYNHYAVPLSARGRVVGVINVFLKPDYGRSPWEEEFLSSAAGVLASILDYKKMEETLKISELKLKEYSLELERKNRELQEFTSIASHDLQEPLRKISSFATLVAANYSDLLPQRGRQYIGRMAECASRMQELIDSLLTYSRVGSDPQPFYPVPMNDAVEEALNNLEIRIKETGAKLELGNLPTIEADRSQMVQLFQNLIGNGLKFRRVDVPARIKIYCDPGEDGLHSGFCRLCVEDNGIGFEEIHAERIFTPFERLNSRHKYGGTGIGLSICKKIVERHHGTIIARSVPDEGSTFVITLPTRQIRA